MHRCARLYIHPSVASSNRPCLPTSKRRYAISMILRNDKLGFGLRSVLARLAGLVNRTNDAMAPLQCICLCTVMSRHGLLHIVFLWCTYIYVVWEWFIVLMITPRLSFLNTIHALWYQIRVHFNDYYNFVFENYSKISSSSQWFSKSFVWFHYNIFDFLLWRICITQYFFKLLAHCLNQMIFQIHD